MRIRIATFEDREDVIKLWKNCFEDSNKYIEFFFNRRWNPKFTPLLIKNNEIIGMAHLLPCVLQPKQNALYWYAVGIRGDYRNQGCFRYLVTTLLQESQAAGHANLCRPRQGLENVYKKYGFSFSYYGNRSQFHQKNNVTANKTNVFFEPAITRDFFLNQPKEGTTLWNLDDIQYAMDENALCGGSAVKITFDNKKYHSLISIKNKTILFHNTNLTADIMGQIQNDIYEKYFCNEIILNSFESSSEWGNIYLAGLSDSNLVNSNSALYFTLE